MSFSFKKVKSYRLPDGDRFFSKVSNFIEKISLDILLEAKQIHRFKARTGNLERSIKNQIRKTDKSIVSRFHFDGRVANYGKFIHNGFHSWKPDPFLENSFDKHNKLIQKTIDDIWKSV